MSWKIEAHALAVPNHEERLNPLGAWHDSSILREPYHLELRRAIRSYILPYSSGTSKKVLRYIGHSGEPGVLCTGLTGSLNWPIQSPHSTDTLLRG
jgi:hypothetical protein